MIDEFEGVRIRPKKSVPIDEFEGVRIRSKLKEDLPIMFGNEYDELITPEDFSSKWESRGKNPNDRLQYLDEVNYRRSSEPNRSGKAYIQHRPTWTDRGKELLQGVGGGLANIPDLASNYVAAPITFLGSKYAKGHGKLLNAIGAEGLAKYANNAGEDLQNLSDKYWNQNLSHEIKNSKALSTKNRDDTAAMLRGAGEFATDILPASGIGVGAKYLARGAKATAPAVKGLKNKAIKWWKEPKLPKIANLLETPITGKNVAAFAGAGAGHGYINTDNWGDKKPSQGALYDIATDMAPMTIGAGIGQGIYSGIKGTGKIIGKGIANGVKETNPKIYNWLTKITNSPKELSNFEKKLAKKIDKGDNTLDNDFITLAKEKEIPLNAFNIYKDNSIPYKISRKNPSEGYLTVLPNMRKNIDDKIKDSLNENLGTYDNGMLSKDFSDNATKIADTLRNRYSDIKKEATHFYTEADKLSSYHDTVKPVSTLASITDLYRDTITPMKRGSGIGKLNKILEDLLIGFKGYTKEMPLKELLNQKRAISQIIDSAPAEIGGLKSREITLLKNVNDAIDKDITYRSKIKDSAFLPTFELANKFWKDHVVPLKQNKLFKNVTENLNVEDTIIKALDDKNKNKELLEILNHNAAHSAVVNLPSTIASKAFWKAAKNHKLTEQELEGILKSLNSRTKDADTDYLKNYVDNTTQTLSKIKRLESERRLITGETSNGKGVDKLIKEIQKTPFTALYPDKVKGTLQNVILPYANKHSDMLQHNKKYRANLLNLSDKSDYYSNKYDITKHLHHWPMIAGSGIGAAAGSATGIPAGNYIGALIGAGVGGGYKYFKSKKIFNAMTDEKFVNELVRLGALPRESKKQVLFDLKERPVLKTEMIRLMFEKRDDKK
jgi:hypothetical protein